MMMRGIKSVMRRAKVLLAVAVLFSAQAALAQAQGAPSQVTVKVKVEMKPDASKAVGLVISTTETLQIPETTVEKVGDKLFDITFKVDRSVLSADSVATAMAFNAAGDIAFANVTPVMDIDAASIASIPDCPAEDPSFAIQFNQYGPLQQLVDVRTERAELARFKISKVLTPDFAHRLTELENALGLKRSEPLSSSLPAGELVDRLSRLDHALKKYKSFRKE